MKIRASEDVTGFAPSDSKWIAVDDDSYDGAEDSHCPIGRGATETDAVIDLLGQMEEAANVRLICAGPDLLAALKDGLSLAGGWREAIVELEDWCHEPVRLKNMLAAADQLDRWAAAARTAIAKAEPPP